MQSLSRASSITSSLLSQAVYFTHFSFFVEPALKPLTRENLSLTLDDVFSGCLHSVDPCWFSVTMSLFSRYKMQQRTHSVGNLALCSWTSSILIHSCLPEQKGCALRVDITTTVFFHNGCDLDRAITDQFLSLTGLLVFCLQMYSKKTHAVDDSLLAIHKALNSGIISVLYLEFAKTITVLCYCVYPRNNFALTLVAEAKWTIMVLHLCFLACSCVAVTRISMDEHMHSFTHTFFFLSILSSAE